MADNNPDARQTSALGDTRDLHPALWIVLFVVIVGLLQMFIVSPLDADAHYHIAVARLTAQHGILHEFPWTAFSWLADNYADKELLLHLVLVPIADLRPADISRIFCTVFGAAVLAALFLIFRREKVQAAGLWTVLVLVSSAYFLVRFSLLRPHLLSLLLVIVLLWSAQRQKRVVLGVTAFLFPLCYTAWHLPVGLMVIGEFSRWLLHRRIDWRGLLVVAGCLLLGIMVHPNFPTNVRFFWIQNFDVLFGTVLSKQVGFDMGPEFEPFDLYGFFHYLLVPAALVVASSIVLWLGRNAPDDNGRDRDSLALAVVITAAVFLLLTLRVQRFIEYLVPFSVYAAALVLGRLRWRWLASAIVLVSICLLLVLGRQQVQAMGQRRDDFSDKASQALQTVIPKNAGVVTCGWGLTGAMMLALPERKFMVALDPVFFWRYDPELYQLWYQTIHDPPAQPAALLKEKFAGQFVLCERRKDWLPFIQAMAQDPKAQLRLALQRWVVFEL